MTKLKVKEYPELKRDTMSNGVINTNVRAYNEYKIVSARIRAREQQGDEIRNAVKEINNLKAELREIKNLIKEVVKK
jgi:flagellar hook-associated protein FlgK